MSQKNETSVLIVSLLVTAALLGAGFWLFGKNLGLGGGAPNPSIGANSGPSAENIPIPDRISQGNRWLVSSDGSPERQAAVGAIANQDYPKAIADLSTSLAQQRNDPEALIYLNNARIGDQPAYTIAVAVPVYSDVNGSLEILRGVAQAQNDLNQAGGINGMSLRVAIARDDNNPEIARQLATALAADRNILGVVGHYASDVTLAAATVYEASKLVTISPVSTSVKLSGFGQYIFRSVPSDFVAARSLADYMLNRQQQQSAAVFFNSQSGYSQSIKSEFVSALSLGGGRVVSEFDLAAATFSPETSLNQATQQGATVLAMFPNSGQLDRALQVIQANQGRLKLLGGDDVYAPKTLEVGKTAAVGMVLAVPWHILANTQTPFVTTSRQLWGGDVNWRTATAYDATQALIEALRRNPTRDGIQQALHAPDFTTPGASNPVQFLPSGDRNQPVQLVEIKPGTRSGFGFDFYPVQK